MSKMMSENAHKPLDEYERSLIESIENDEWKPVEDKEQQIREAQEYAKATMRKDKRMNIRISERDLRNLKVAALEEGIPYQTLVSMVLHKYVARKFRKRKIEIREYNKSLE